MDRRALVAIVLCGLVWAGWTALYYPRRAPRTPKTQAAPPLTNPVQPALAPPEHAAPAQSVTLTQDDVSVRLSAAGARPVDVELHRYRESVDPDSPTIHWLQPSERASLLPRLDNSSGRNLLPNAPRFDVVEASDTHVVFRWEGPAGDGRVVLMRRYTLRPETYKLALVDTIENVGPGQLAGRPVISLYESLKSGVGKGRRADQFAPIAQVDGRIQRRAPRRAGESRTAASDEPVGWFGIHDRYFIAALIPSDPVTGRTALSFDQPTDGLIGVTLAREPIALEPGERATFAASLFVGPKDMALLRPHGLDKVVVSNRFLHPIAEVLLRLLGWLHRWCGNWGLAILLMTVLIKALLLPLTHKSMKMMRQSQVKMARVQPEINRLKKQYAEPEDREKLNQETMALFRKHGVHPLSSLGGCVPMILQMPIWFALYRVLYSDVDLRQAPLFAWIVDLSAPDPLYILPVLLGVLMLAQQRVTPQAAAGNETQKKLMKWAMPVVFTFIMLKLPAGLVLYIAVNTTLSVLQGLYIRKTMGIAEVPASEENTNTQAA